MFMKRSFSIVTLCGVVLGFGLFFYAIFRSTDNFLMFVNLNSIIMVLGGTIAGTMIAYHGRYVFKTIQYLAIVIFPFHISPQGLMQDIKNTISWSKVKQLEGMRVFEEKVKSTSESDQFVMYCTNLVVSGYKGNALRTMIEDSIDTDLERDMIQVNILHTMASFSPSFGMLGTLVGLIIMLEQMGGDITKIGPGLALALLTTLYGILFAQLVFRPAAVKVQQTIEILRFRKILVMEGFLLIVEGKTGYEIQDKLNSYLAPTLHIDLSKEPESG
jgi:chemotaxis protein MotA